MHLQNNIGVNDLIRYLTLLQNMSVKNYTNFLLSPGDYNFKINYLKDKMGHGVQVHILLNNLASVHSNISIALVHEVKML